MQVNTWNRSCSNLVSSFLDLAIRPLHLSLVVSVSRSVVDIPRGPPSPTPVVVHVTIDTEGEVLEPPETQYHHSCPDGKPNELFSV